MEHHFFEEGGLAKVAFIFGKRLGLSSHKWLLVVVDCASLQIEHSQVFTQYSFLTFFGVGALSKCE